VILEIAIIDAAGNAKLPILANPLTLIAPAMLALPVATIVAIPILPTLALPRTFNIPRVSKLPAVALPTTLKLLPMLALAAFSKPVTLLFSDEIKPVLVTMFPPAVICVTELILPLMLALPMLTTVPVNEALPLAIRFAVFKLPVILEFNACINPALAYKLVDAKLTVLIVLALATLANNVPLLALMLPEATMCVVPILPVLALPVTLSAPPNAPEPVLVIQV